MVLSGHMMVRSSTTVAASLFPESVFKKLRSIGKLFPPRTALCLQLCNKPAYLRGRDQLGLVIEDDAFDIISDVSPVKDVGNIG